MRGVQPPVGVTVNSAPPLPAPARPCPSPKLAQLLALYRECLADGTWARVILETRDGEEELSFCCSSLYRAAPSSAAPTTTRKQGKQRPANERRRRRQQAWRESKNARAAATAPAATAAVESTAVAEVPTAAATAPAATAAARNAGAAMEAASTVKTGVATAQTAPPPAKRLKVSVAATRASARAAVVAKRRDPEFSLESPEILRGHSCEGQLNESLRIESQVMQREEEEEKDESMEKEKEKEREEQKENEPQAELKPPPPPPPWSKFFSHNSLRVLCTKCFQGNHHVRAPYCVQCDNEFETDVYRNFY